MNKASRLLLATAASAALGLTAPHTRATPVSVSAFSFAPGSGYGVDADEKSGTRLDVNFGSSFSTQSFTLVAVGDSRTLTLGTVALREKNANGAINSDEVDGLGVAANLSVTDPFVDLVQMLVTGSADPGSVSDAAIDFTLDWDPVQIAFGAGGLLEISLNDLNFTGLQTLTQTATITLLRTTEVSRVARVPEPGTLVLAGLALAGLAFVRRSRGN